MSNLPEILKQLKAEINLLIQEKEYSKIPDKIEQLYRQITHKNDSVKEHYSGHLKNIFEKDLIEKENYLDLILNSVNSGILLIDPETHNIIDINKYALNILNYQKEEVIGKECHEFICPSVKGNCPITDLNKKVEESVRELISREGERRYILKNVKEIIIDGKPYLLETFTDFHKQKQIEHELKTLNEELEKRIVERTEKLELSEEKYKNIFNNVLDAIYLYEVDKNNWPGKFIEINAIASKRLGYTREEFLKMSPLDINIRDKDKIVGERMDELLLNKYMNFESVHKSKDGREINVEINSHLIEIDGKKRILSVARDISERKKAEEALKKSEEKFRKLADLSPSGISIQRKNKYFYVNSAWSEITGYDVEKKDEVGPFDIIHPDMKDLVRKRSNDKLRKEGAKLRYDLKIITKEKKIKWLDISITTIYFENQNATFAICNDITEVRKIQEALKLSEAKFRSLTELSPAAICIQTTDKFLWANPAWSEISGYPIDEVLKMGPLDVIHPDMQDIARKRSDARLDNEDVVSRYNLKILTKDKQAKWVDMAITVIEFEGQTASLAVSTDITKIVEFQQALKESEAKYRSLIENLKQEYFFYRHNVDRIFEYVSPSIKNILGFEQKDFLAHYAKYLTDNPINKTATEKTELAIKGIQQKPYELEIFDSNKNIHILEVSETPIMNDEGNVIAIEGIARDITKQKNAEKTIKDQLKKIQINNEEIKSINEEIHAVNDDLERRIEDINELNENLKISEEKSRILNAQKDKFFSIIAHDLRSPIGNFVQISELLNQKYKELSEDQANMFLSNLNTLANSTFKLLDNLLMWSRSQLGRLETKNENVNVYKIVEDIRDLCDENLKTKGLEFVNDISKELNIYTDLNIIQTVFRNLIYNAIKFTSKGGKITIKSKNEIVSKNKINVILIVKDSGIGIPKDKIEKIFDIDYDYTTPGTENEKGTGLGLILCKELIEKIGGEIWVESEEGKGSTFYFTLKR
ncbi:MAG: PAS domain S-box protein [Bacteroidales bacterium]|nr:PAS domain S-box protein [Bacteroidales bacterium]